MRVERRIARVEMRPLYSQVPPETYYCYFIEIVPFKAQTTFNNYVYLIFWMIKKKMENTLTSVPQSKRQIKTFVYTIKVGSIGNFFL